MLNVCEKFKRRKKYKDKLKKRRWQNYQKAANDLKADSAISMPIVVNNE